MSVLISDEDYKEYRILQHNALYQMKLNSVKGLANLRDDIDVPMQKLVAMFALLGCMPMYSCCGFDYDGQPMHKTHEYGDTYIMFNDTMRIRSVLKILNAGKRMVFGSIENSRWTRVKNHPNTLLLVCDFDYEHRRDNYPWSKDNCIHYPEMSVIRIKEMEDNLSLYFEDEFADVAVVRDTNKSQKKYNHYWQYPALEDWIITKEEMLEL